MPAERQRQKGMLAERQRQTGMLAERQRQTGMLAERQRQAGSTSSPLSDDQNDQTGVAVGVSVAVIVLVVAGTLLAVFWMKRSKRFCFETKSDSAASRGQSDGERESDYDQIKETSNYEFESVPKGNVPNTHRYLTLDTSTNGTATTAHVTTDEDDYNVLSHNSPPHSPVKSNADAYSHINKKKKGQKRCDVIDDDDYDTAGSNVTSSRDPTYNHVIDDVTDGDYDTAGSNVTSARDPTYNHITGSQIDDVTDGDYDTAGSNVMSARDPTYSHIKGEVEGDYSTAGGDSTVEPVASDDYSHIGGYM
ncbi:uncharacterized protein LOC121385110 [Gigantopelta aegis]|uniref:uncharacterized protein LOC121385110 n=1 Tax=Gigantopelta aegis TaxID=1735272 RepID=UPI001B88C942|nr:uncharacterized protein LOC121385110 [Gigantopelta aegis]